MEEEFVVCPACGTRIKAGREFCLRCFAPLPTAERPIKPSMWVSLGLSDTKKQVVIGAIAAVVVGLVVLIYLTEPPEVDDTPRPAATAVTPRPAAAPGESGTAAPATSSESAAAGSAGVFELAPVAAPSPLSAADVAGLDAKRTAYESQLATSPDDPTLLNDLGLVLDQLGRSGDAIPRFERAIELSPQQANFHFNLAHAAVGAGLWDRAVTEYRAAARLRPQDYLAQYAVALTLHRKGDDADAIPEFQKAIKLSPNDPNAHLALGVSLEIVGRADEAVKEFRRYLAIQPTSADADRLRAHLHALGVANP